MSAEGVITLIARDVMQRDVRAVGPEATLQEVAEILAQREYSGLPVVDDEGRLLGIVTEGDLLVRARRLQLPLIFPFIGGHVYLENPRRFEEQLRKAVGVNVTDVMTKDVVAVAEDTPLHELAEIMVQRKINRLPVANDGRLVGLVTRDDIIRAVHLQSGNETGKADV